MATTTRASGDNKQSEKKTSKSSANGGSTGGTTAALIGVGAAGVALGIAAMIGRKFAVQAPTMLAGDWDKALAAEHAATLKIFDALEATSNNNTTKRRILLMQMKHALAKHALQEENAVYPALREAGHAQDADILNAEHGYVKQYLYELTNCPKDSERFLDILRRFRAHIEHHVREEEDQLFPQLKAALNQQQNAELTKEMNKEGLKLA